MALRGFAHWLFALVWTTNAAASEVTVLTSDTFDDYVKNNKYAMVKFYAPWCGHCKKLEPEDEKAAAALQGTVSFGKVDATADRDLSAKFKVKGFPTMIWFAEGEDHDYDGGRTSASIQEWISSMVGPAVVEVQSEPLPPADKPQVILRAQSILEGFESAAKTHRRKASWFHIPDANAVKVIVRHKGEEPLEITDGCDDREKVSSFLLDNVMPLFGTLDNTTWDRYMDAGKGLIWTLMPTPEDGFEAVQAQQRPIMSEVAKKFKDKYFVTITDTKKFGEAVDNMLSLTTFPAIAVQKKAGDKQKFVYHGPMVADDIIKFVQDVENGTAQANFRSQDVPPPSNDPVKVVVGSTLKEELFRPDKDVALVVYAPWCGHCKKLHPEFTKLAKKIKQEEMDDILTMAMLDGTANDSPLDNVDWTGFPTILFSRAGSDELMSYDGERTAKGIWKYIKKHSSKADEIRERLDKRRFATKKAEEL